MPLQLKGNVMYIDHIRWNETKSDIIRKEMPEADESKLIQNPYKKDD